MAVAQAAVGLAAVVSAAAVLMSGVHVRQYASAPAGAAGALASYLETRAGEVGRWQGIVSNAAEMAVQHERTMALNRQAIQGVFDGMPAVVGAVETMSRNAGSASDWFGKLAETPVLKGIAAFAQLASDFESFKKGCDTMASAINAFGAQRQTIMDSYDATMKTLGSLKVELNAATTGMLPESQRLLSDTASRFREVSGRTELGPDLIVAAGFMGFFIGLGLVLSAWVEFWVAGRIGASQA